MKKQILSIITVGAMAVAGSAYAADMSTAPAAAPSASGSAPASNGMYATFNGGASLMNNSNKGNEASDTKYKTGWDIGAAAGYRYQNFRFEGNLGYLKNDVDGLSSGDSQNVTLTPILANVYYDVNTGSAFVPYVGAGVGGAYFDSDADLKNVGTIKKLSVTSSKMVFAYDAKVGLGYNVNQNWRVGLDYTYLATLKSKFTFKSTADGVKQPDEISDKMSFDSNLINLGVTYFF